MPLQQPSSRCVICDSGVKGFHSYYGSNGSCCHSCRTFFRRSVKSGKSGSFACKSAKECEIDSFSWRTCQFCRSESFF